MAITATQVSAPHGTGTFTAAAWTHGDVRGSWSDEWVVRGLATSATPHQVLGQIVGMNSIQYPGTVWATNDRFVLASVALRHESTEDVWKVTLNYEPNPLAMPVEIHRFSSHLSEAIFKDERGVAIKNSAGFPYSQPMEISRAYERVEIIRRMTPTQVKAIKTSQYVHHQNSSTFLGETKGKVYMSDFRAPFVWEPAPHHLCTFVFEIKDEGWKRSVLEQGSKCRQNSNTSATQWVTTTDGKAGGTALLDVEGRQLPVGSDPVFYDWDVIPYADFNLLGIFNGCAAPPEGRPAGFYHLTIFPTGT